MEILTKTYRIVEGELKFEFHYEPGLVSGFSDFDITDISPLKYGYDSSDAKEISIYPSNISITIDDFTGDNYYLFKKMLSSYNVTYPLNHYNIFYLQIKLNNVIIFNGILDELNSDHESKTLELSFVDGINKYKDISIANPLVLDLLFWSSLIPRSVDSTLNSAWAYGFGEIRYYVGIDPLAGVYGPGYAINSLSSGDRDTKLSTLITALIKLLRHDLLIDYNNEYLFGDLGVPIDQMVTIEQVNIRRILSNLLGRYVVMRKVPGRVNEFAPISTPQYFEWRQPEKFELVYEDGNYKVYYHNWSGVTADLKKWEKGIDEKTIGDILKVIARNTFSYFGLKEVNKFFFRHKRFLSDPEQLTEILSMNKVLTIDRADGVRIDDYYTDSYATAGSDYGNDENRINFKIPFNALATANGYEYRLNYYVGSNEKKVINFYDRQLNFKAFPEDVICKAEWEAHRTFTDQYEFELGGINYDFDKTYSVNFENYVGKFRPITIKKDLLNSKTNMTALEI